MSKRTWTCAAAALVLAGCGPTHYIIDGEASSSAEVHAVQGSDGVMLGAIALHRAATDVSDAQRQRCIRATLEPQPVRVERGRLMTPVHAADSAYNADTRDADSPNEAGGTGHVTGITDWQGRTIAYRLELQTLPEANYYYFDRIGERSASVDGQAPRFEPIGAWSEAAPMQVRQGLSALTDRLQSCLAGAAAGSRQGPAADS